MVGIIVSVAVLLLIFLLSSIKQIGEYERGLKFTFGKFTKILDGDLYCQFFNHIERLI